MPKVSIIMPSLNVAPYIRECIESVINQTLDDIEILCIDAGSTDGTLEILKKYASKDCRIKLINSAKKSYGYQINTGFDMAQGDYIGIVETDDYIDKKMYETMYSYAVQNSLDIVKTDFDVFTEIHYNKRILLTVSLKRYFQIKYNEILSSSYFIDRKNTIDVFIWNGLYSRAFIKKYNIRLNESPGAAFQDCGFRYQAIIYARRIMYINESFYRYRRDNIHSSTYNPNTLSYNLAECNYIRNIVSTRKIVRKDILSFLAREYATICIVPYKELLMYGDLPPEHQSLLNEFSKIFMQEIKSGLLKQSNTPQWIWLNVSMLINKPELFNEYIKFHADTELMAYTSYLTEIKPYKNIIIFCNGFLGKNAHCLLTLNGINNIVAFCDNDKNKHGTMYCGCPVISPNEAIKLYPDAYFIIANTNQYSNIKYQLISLGVSEEHFSLYPLDDYPLYSTNLFISNNIRRKLSQ